MDITLQRPGAVLRGTVVGAGPSILLLHAGGERRQVWAPVAEVLAAAGFRSVAFDQRGHGESTGVASELLLVGDDVAAMLAMEPPPRVVVGASLGGLATLAALRDPRLGAGLWGVVLVDVVPDPEPDRVRRFLAVTRMILESGEGFVEDALSRAPLLRQAAATLDMPVLLVRGSGSPITDEDADRLGRLAPQTTVIRIPGASHLVARDQPVALAEAIATAAATWSRHERAVRSRRGDASGR